MKCDELTAYKGDIYIPVYGSIADAEVYLKEKVDAILAKKDKEIEKLKAKLARNGWHSMDEELPGVDEYVFCYGGDAWNGYGYSMLKITEDKDEIGNPIWTDGSGVPICIDEITHWMYLPTPPKDDEVTNNSTAQ